MKRKLFSIALAAALCLALLPTAAMAATTVELHASDLQGSGDYSLENGKTYVLREDITSGKTIKVPIYVVATLDLNGHVLGFSGGSGANLIEILADGKLTVTDSAPAATHSDPSLPAGGCITGSIANSGYLSGTGTFTGSVSNSHTIEGGTFMGSVSNSSGGKIYGGIFCCPVTFGHDGCQVTPNDPPLAFYDTLTFTIAPSNHFYGTFYHKKVGNTFQSIIGSNSAHFGSTHTVTFYDGADVCLLADVTHDTLLAQPLPPAKPGYDFQQWYADSTLSTLWDFTTGAITSDTALYARYTPQTYTITYSGTTGAAFASPQPGSHTYGTSTSVPNLTKPDDTFMGWRVNGASTPVRDLVLGATAYTENITLAAVWASSLPPASTEKDDPTYTITVKESANGSVSANYTSASSGTPVTLTVSPKSGYTLGSLTATDKQGTTLKLVALGKQQYRFWMPNSPVTVTSTFSAAYQDVPPESYYQPPVEWGRKNGIVGGTSADTFEPDSACTRAQAVTFLWRAAGQPAAPESASRFPDVADTAYYAEAVRWAESHGIVLGYGDGTFRPDQTITRQQSAAILYRFAVSQGMDVSVGEDTNILSYHDALTISEYAFPAMQWAVGAGIMQGNQGSLLPRSSCTRAHIITFLYRLLGE